MDRKFPGTQIAGEQKMTAGKQKMEESLSGNAISNLCLPQQDKRRPVEFSRTGIITMQEDGGWFIQTDDVINWKKEIGHMEGSLVRITIEQLPDSPSAAH